jgi:hypothetical protein
MCLEVSVTAADEFQRKGKARWTRRRRNFSPTALRGGYAVRDEDDDDDMVACVAVSHGRYCVEWAVGRRVGWASSRGQNAMVRLLE